MDQVAGKGIRKMSKADVKDSVLTLISGSQQLGQLLHEIVSVHQETVDTMPHSAGDNITDICSISILRDQALMPNTTGGILAAKQCCRKLVDIVKFNKTQILTGPQLTDVQSVLAIIRRLCCDGSFPQSHFEDQLGREEGLPLQLVWMLHVEGVVTLASFLSRSASVDRIVSGIQQYLAAEPAAGLVTELMNIGYADSRATDASVRKFAIVVLETLILEFIDEPVPPAGHHTHPLVVAFGRADMEVDVMKKAFTHLITTILSHRPLLKVSQAIREQNQWSYGKTDKDLVQFYKQVLLPFGVQEVLELLRQVLERQEVNWWLLLSFVSTVIVCLTDAPAIFLEFTDQLLRSGLDGGDFEMTITATLLVRQACLQGVHAFMSYADWYQRTFSDSSKSLANNRKSFTFFMKFLTDLVPYEPAQNIQVHILRPPFVPAKCRQLLADYIVLAKTRLADLRESLDDPVQRDGASKPGDPGQMAVQACSDVEKAVTAFSCTGKVPSFIMEASIFRKPYYISQFLPTLLKPRPRPDIPDAKMKLIETLRKADKIPATVYSNHDKACKREAAQLLAGVFLDLDSDDDMELDPMDQLDNSLKQLTAAVTRLCSGLEDQPSKFTVVEAVSLVCERLGTVMSAGPDRAADRQPVLDLDVDHPCIRGQHLQVVDKLLNSISRGLQVSYTSTNPQFTWLTPVVTGLTQYGELYRSLCCRMWTLLVDQGLQLDNHHIDSLAAILVELQLLGDKLPRIRLSGSCAQCEDDDHVAVAIIKQIPVSEGRWMSLSLRLISAFLKFGYSSHPEEENLFIFPSLVKKFAYLSPRLVPRLRLQPHIAVDTLEDSLVVAMYSSHMVQALIHNNKFTLAEWVDYEVNVNPQCDALTDLERHSYFSWVIYRHYLSMSRVDGGFGGDYKAAASDLLQGIVKLHLRVNSSKPACRNCGARPSQEGETNSCQMLALLHELIQLFPYCDGEVADQVSDVLPWLPGQLKAMLSSVKTHLEKDAIVGAFFRASIHLPAYLLYRDSQQAPADPRSVDPAVPLLNTVLVDHISEGVVLPVAITIYLLQGLLPPGLTPAESSGILDHMCQRCPVAAASFVAHYTAIAPLIDLHCRTTTPTIKATAGWVIGSDIHGPPPPNSWLCSAAIFSHCRNQQSLEAVLGRAQRGMDEDTFKEVLVDLTHLLLVQLTVAYFYTCPQEVSYCSDQLSTTIQYILHLHGSLIIGHLLQSQVSKTTQMAVPRKYLEVQHLTLMRVICASHNVKLFSTVAAGHHLNGLLKLFSKVCKTFDMICPELNEDGSIIQAIRINTPSGLTRAGSVYACQTASGTILISIMEAPLTLEDVVTYSKFVKDIILQAPPVVIQDISQSLLRDCGPDILQTAQRRIQSGSRGNVTM